MQFERLQARSEWLVRRLSDADNQIKFVAATLHQVQPSLKHVVGFQS